MGATPKSSERDQYSEQETQQRFENLVRAALNTRPKPLKTMLCRSLILGGLGCGLAALFIPSFYS
jgi:hypothetical protein